jgi:hypothetical protein
MPQNAPRRGASCPAAPQSRQVKPIGNPLCETATPASYPCPGRPVHLQNPSPTRPPQVSTDVDVWAHWQDVSIDALNLDAFDDDGNLVRPDHVLARWGA